FQAAPPAPVPGRLTRPPVSPADGDHPVLRYRERTMRLVSVGVWTMRHVPGPANVPRSPDDLDRALTAPESLNVMDTDTGRRSLFATVRDSTLQPLQSWLTGEVV